jgi:hypothetical protein
VIKATNRSLMACTNKIVPLRTHLNAQQLLLVVPNLPCACSMHIIGIKIRAYAIGHVEITDSASAYYIRSTDRGTTSGQVGWKLGVLGIFMIASFRVSRTPSFYNVSPSYYFDNSYSIHLCKQATWPIKVLLSSLVAPSPNVAGCQKQASQY